MSKPRHPNLLGEDPRPLFFPVTNADAVRLEAPANRHGAALRTWVRALAGMQKEAVVVSGTTGRAWRLVSDEGPYLAGWDVGPCPLSFLTTGMVASYMNEIRALAAMRAIDIRDIRLTLDNRYTMNGSLLRGTMRGGALDPELHAEIDTDADESAVQQLVVDAIGASPIHGLLRGVHTSLFTLSHNGRPISVDQVAPLPTPPPPPDPGDPFAKLDHASDDGDAAIRKVTQGARVEGVAHGVGSSLQDSQSRQLHVRGTCTLRADGVKEIEQVLFKPIGSTFRYLSDEAPPANAGQGRLSSGGHGIGGRGLAPDAATYMSAGIGFCFMTQFGRFAEIQKKPIDAYHIVQDTHFSLGGASGGTGVAGTADPVETHVFLTTGHDDDFARRALDMSEQTCFLHAFCRTELKTQLRLGRPNAAASPAASAPGPDHG